MFDRAAYDRFAETWLRIAYPPTVTPALPPFSIWRDQSATYLAVGTVVDVRGGFQVVTPRSKLVCELDEGVPDPSRDDCFSPATHQGLLEIRFAVSEVVPFPGREDGVPAPDDEVTLTAPVGFASEDDDVIGTVVEPVSDALPEGHTFVGVVRVDPEGNHIAMLPGGWAVVDGDGTLHLPFDPSWHTDLGFAPFQTLEQLLEAARGDG